MQGWALRDFADCALRLLSDSCQEILLKEALMTA